MRCVNCGREIEERKYGIIITPPESSGCERHHFICKDCYEVLIRDIVEKSEKSESPISFDEVK
jgi:hypothetical protein